MGIRVDKHTLPVDALELANAKYTVRCENMCCLHLKPNAQDLVVIPSNIKGIYRTDRLDKLLGYCSKVWKPIQNIDLFGKFTDQVKEHELRVDHVGVLNSGKLCYMLFKVKEDRKQWIGKKEVLLYLLVSNAFDGETAIKVKPLIVRYPGYITLSMTSRIVRHSSIADGRFDVNKFILESRGWYEEMIERYKRMADLPDITENEIHSMLNDIFMGRSRSIYPDLERILDIGICSVHSGTYTLWDWYCAVCEYLNFHIGNYNQAIRMIKLWFGENTKLSHRSLSYALRVANDLGK